MTREDIIRMAREAASEDGTTRPDKNIVLYAAKTSKFLERFAQLVRAYEREACVQIVEEYRIPVGNSVAGELAREWTYYALKEIREDIRARGQA